MKVHINRWCLSFVVLALLPIATFARAEGPMHARVSFDAGGTLVKGNEDSDWGHATLNTLLLPGDTLWVRESGTTEIEMPGGSFLRMADGSKVELTALSPELSLGAATGSFYVQRLRRSTGLLSVQLPACRVEVVKDSCARFDVVGDGSTTVSVLWGEAVIRVEGAQDQSIRERQRVYVDPGKLPSDPVGFDPSREDDFDSWNRERAEFLATGTKTRPPNVPVPESTLGSTELASYGNWIDYDGRQYWRPTVANYVPYRNGHWSYVPTTGYVWVESYPFAYVTSHYGRWIYVQPYGWIWGYDRVWSPAWCATVRYGDNFLWTPVGFDNRPVIIASGPTFNIGGIAFSFGASTFVPQERIYFGPSYVSPLRPAIIQNINVTNINIWNINVRSDNLFVNVPYRDNRLTLYKSTPKSILRGPELLGRNTITARAEVQSLERARGTLAKERLAPKRVNTAERTVASKAEKSEKIRTVRIEPQQRTRSLENIKTASTPDSRAKGAAKGEVSAPAATDAVKGQEKSPRGAADKRQEAANIPQKTTRPDVSKQQPSATKTTEPGQGRMKEGTQGRSKETARIPEKTTRPDVTKQNPSAGKTTEPGQGRAKTEPRVAPGKGQDKEMKQAAPGPQSAPRKSAAVESGPPKAKTTPRASDAERGPQKSVERAPASKKQAEPSLPSGKGQADRGGTKGKDRQPEAPPKSAPRVQPDKGKINTNAPQGGPTDERDKDGRGKGGEKGGGKNK
jgi:hypothetical protein